ncbi:MAG: hypothetical protein JWR19_4000 [Pedosphaera sp.]|nr:hypothetical protein [Pedosphaera sp.]
MKLELQALMETSKPSNLSPFRTSLVTVGLKAVLLFIAVIALPASQAQSTIGLGIGSEGSDIDGAATTYVYTQQGFGSATIGSSLSAWAFYSGNFFATRSITPLLFEYSGTGNDYVLRAVGAAVTVSAHTAYSDLPFDVQFGSTLIANGNYFFGWKDGTLTSANSGVISWDTIDGGNSTYALTANSSQDITSADLGNTLSFDNTSLGNRTYQFQATVVSTPEPSFSLWLMGAIALIVVGFRRPCRPAASLE